MRERCVSLPQRERDRPCRGQVTVGIEANALRDKGEEPDPPESSGIGGGPEGTRRDQCVLGQPDPQRARRRKAVMTEGGVNLATGYEKRGRSFLMQSG